MKEIIELSPYMVCPTCEEFKKLEKEYLCKINCFRSKNLEEIWEDCPFLHKKYLIRETSDDSV